MPEHAAIAAPVSSWVDLARHVLAGHALSRDEAVAILRSPEDELLAVVQAAFAVRLRHFDRGVSLHVIRNAQSGLCTEDCAFCSQSAVAKTPIPRYPLQSVKEIVEGARAAHALKAMRYCIVISGRGPAPLDLTTLCEAVRTIKRELPIQICVSPGLLTPGQAAQLKAAGVDRVNHNLETAERFYGSICTTHRYAERVATARVAKAAGLELCSGGLIGMGETREDRADLALALRELDADSIPVNFLDPRPGTPLEGLPRLTPAEALRTLAMFRLANPDREIRIAGGREACLGPLQALALFVANSMFTTGYLTTPGQGYEADLALIAAAGFHVAGISE